MHLPGLVVMRGAITQRSRSDFKMTVHVSMSLSATRRRSAMLENVQNVIAIELLDAPQGLHFFSPL